MSSTTRTRGSNGSPSGRTQATCGPGSPQDIEAWAKSWGADVLRSDTGGANERSMRLHGRAGLTVYRYNYKKRLRP